MTDERATETAATVVLAAAYRVGPWRVQRDSGEIDDGARQTRLEPRVLAVLDMLVLHAGELVSRQALLDGVWQDVVVGEEALTRCISELRSALGDSRSHPEFIETVPKRGYRLIARVAADAGHPDARPTSPGVRTGTDADPGANANANVDVDVDLEADAVVDADADAHGDDQGAAPTEPAPEPVAPAPYRWPAVAGAGGLALLVAVTGWLVFGRPTQPPASAAVAGELRLIVEPFSTAAAGSNPANGNYFGIGVAEALRTSLQGVTGMQAVGVAQDLSGQPAQQCDDVPAAACLYLGGTLERSAGHIEIAVQLRDAAGNRRWQARFDDIPSRLPSLQQRMTVAIADQLGLVAPTPVDRGQQTFEALDLYLLGRHHWRQRTELSLGRAADLFNQALDLDPQLAAAWAGLADTWLLLTSYGYSTSAEAVAVAGPAIERALQLQPDLADAHASLGLLRLVQDDSGGALSALQHATTLDPNNPMAQMWLGNALARIGDVRGARRAYGKALALDPSSVPARTNLVASELDTGAIAAAADHLEPVLAAQPDNPTWQKLAARLALDRGQTELAEGYGRQLLAGGSDVRGLLVLAGVAERRGQAELLMTHLDAAFELEPDDFEVAYAKLQMTARHASLSELEALLAAHFNPTTINPTLSRLVLAARGTALLRAGEFAAAAGQFSTALASGMPKPGALVHRLGMLSHAVAALRAAGQPRAAALRVREGETLLARAADQGWASTDFLVESAYFLAAAGHDSAARDRFQRLDREGLLAVGYQDDPRLVALASIEASVDAAGLAAGHGSGGVALQLSSAGDKRLPASTWSVTESVEVDD